MDIKKERGTISGDSSANSGRISGGVGWKIEFNTPDCQHGWSVIKMGSGQSIGCYFKEEDAKAALEALAVTEPIVKAEGGWAGAFSPFQKKKDEVRKCMTCGCDDMGNDHHYISDTEKCMYCLDKGQGPCWDGYAYAGTKQGENGKTVPNCIPVKKDDVSGQTKQDEQEGIGRLSVWNGSFAPVMGNQKVTPSWQSTYNTPPQKDGTPTVGYGNHSDPKGRSNQ